MAQTQRPDYSGLGQLVPELSTGLQETYRPDDIPLIYADATAGFGLGVNVSRITLSKVVHLEAASNPPKEIRQISAHVILPTSAMIELLTTVLNSLKSNPEFRAQAAANADAVFSWLDKLSIE